jgi:hypothetical protein
MLFLIVEEEAKDKEKLTVDEFLNNLRKLIQFEKSAIQIINTKDIETGLSNSIKILTDYSQEYYNEKATKLRKKNTKIDKKNTQPEQVLRNIKISFCYEVLGNQKKYSKHLINAYNYIQDLYTYNSQLAQMNEFRVLGDYLNLKIYLQQIFEKKIDTAIKTFLSHIQWFKSLKQDKDNLQFEHEAQLFRQYKTFSEIIEKVVIKNQNNTKDPYTNPGKIINLIIGYFYLAAAMAATKRKNFSKKICEQYQKEITEYTEKNSEKLSENEITKTNGFIGHRKGKNWFIKEISRENNFKHSEQITLMLTKSYDHYFSLNLTRMIYYIANLIAEVHFSEKQWDRANKFFERISKCYRKEGWHEPLTTILKYSLTCSKELEDSKQYISYSLELLSNSILKFNYRIILKFK